VLIMVVVFVLLNAGALHVGGRLRAKTLACRKNLKEIGTALVDFCDMSDGTLPALERDTYIYHYYIVRRETAPSSGVYKWLHLGCLYDAGLLSDGRTFYCPVAEGATDEYLIYSNPAPWGTLPQVYNSVVGNQWVRTREGYLYWPQSTTILTSAPTGEMWPNYEQGYPTSATAVTYLDQTRAVVADIVFHQEERGKVNALFWDGSVVYQNGPTGADGTRWYFDSMQRPDGEDGWELVKLARWMYALQQ